MPKRCVVCGNYYIPGLVSLHILPKDVEKRTKWVQALNNIEIDPLCQHVYVCSDHFNECDFYVSPAGIKSIKNKAIPFIRNVEETLSDETSSVVSEKNNQERTSFDSESQCDDVTSKGNRRRRKPVYFGDCHLSDMNISANARRNWLIAETTINKQRKKIRQLEQNNRRLKFRLQKLQSLLTYLKNKNT